MCLSEVYKMKKVIWYVVGVMAFVNLAGTKCYAVLTLGEMLILNDNVTTVSGSKAKAVDSINNYLQSTESEKIMFDGSGVLQEVAKEEKEAVFRNLPLPSQAGQMWPEQIANYLQYGMYNNSGWAKLLEVVAQLDHLKRKKLERLILGSYDKCAGETYVEWVTTSKPRLFTYSIGGVVRRQVFTRTFPVRNLVVHHIEDLFSGGLKKPKHFVRLKESVNLRERYLQFYGENSVLAEQCLSRFDRFSYTAGKLEMPLGVKLFTGGKDLELSLDTLSANPMAEIDLSAKGGVVASPEADFPEFVKQAIANSIDGVNGLKGEKGERGGDLYLKVSSLKSMPTIRSIGGDGRIGRNGTNGKDSLPGKEGSRAFIDKSGEFSWVREMHNSLYNPNLKIIFQTSDAIESVKVAKTRPIKKHKYLPGYRVEGVYDSSRVPLMGACWVGTQGGTKFSGEDASANGRGGDAGMGGDPGDGGMIYISGGEESNSEGPFVLHSGKVGAPGLAGLGGKTNEGKPGHEYLYVNYSCSCGDGISHTYSGICLAKGTDGVGTSPQPDGQVYANNNTALKSNMAPVNFVELNLLDAEAKKLALHEKLAIAESAYQAGSLENLKVAALYYSEIKNELTPESKTVFNAYVDSFEDTVAYGHQKELKKILLEYNSSSDLEYRTAFGLWKLSSNLDFFGKPYDSVPVRTYGLLKDDFQKTFEEYKSVYSERKRLIEQKIDSMEKLSQISAASKSEIFEYDLIKSEIEKQKIKVEAGQQALDFFAKKIDSDNVNLQFSKKMLQLQKNMPEGVAESTINSVTAGILQGGPAAWQTYGTSIPAAMSLQWLHNNAAKRNNAVREYQQYYLKKMNVLGAENSISNAEFALSMSLYQKEAAELDVSTLQKEMDSLLLQQERQNFKQNELLRQKSYFSEKFYFMNKYDFALSIYNSHLLKLLRDMQSALMYKWKTLNVEGPHGKLSAGLEYWEPSDFSEALEILDAADRNMVEKLGVTGLDPESRMDSNMQKHFLTVDFDSQSERSEEFQSFLEKGSMDFNITFRDFDVDFGDNETKRPALLEVLGLDVWYENVKVSESKTCFNVAELPLEVSMSPIQYSIDTRNPQEIVSFHLDSHTPGTDIFAKERYLVKGDSRNYCDYDRACGVMVDDLVSMRSAEMKIDRFPYRSPVTTWTIKLHPTFLLDEKKRQQYLSCVEGLKFVLLYRYLNVQP